MQEEVTQKTIAFSIKSAKLTIQVLQAAARKFLETQNKGKTKLHHGQQSLKQLKKHGAALSNIEITDANICLLNQASGDRRILAERLNISPQQLRYVDNSEPGEGLLIYENVILPFRNPIPQRSQLYKIMTTRLGEGETV